MLALVTGSARTHEDPGSSIMELTDHIAAEPDNAELYASRAKLHRIEQNWQAAIDDLDRAVELGEDPAPLNIFRGEALLGLSRTDEAVQALSDYIEFAPDDSSGREIRGDTYMADKDYAAAASDYAAAIDIESQPGPELYLKLAEAHTANDDIDAAIEALDAGVIRLGNVISLIQQAIELESGRGAYDGALTWLDRVPPKLQATPDWLLKRGDLLQQDGQQEAAERAWTRALETWEAMPEPRRKLPANQRVKTSIDQRLAATESA